jgi:hypothetical protein
MDNNTNTLVLPQDRPLVGSDLLALQTKFGCQVDELLFAFKMSPNRWSQVSKKQATQTVSPNIELVARVYDQWPNTWPIKKAPSLKSLREVLDINKIADLGLFFGKDSITGSRWLQGEAEAERESGRKVNKAGSHGTAPLVKLQTSNLYKLGTEGKRDELVGLVNDCAKLRGIDDIWKRGSWVTDHEALLKNIFALRKKAQSTIDSKANSDDVARATSIKVYCQKFLDAYHGLVGDPDVMGQDGLYKKIKKGKIMSTLSENGKAIYEKQLAEVKELEVFMVESQDSLERILGKPLVPQK